MCNTLKKFDRHIENLNLSKSEFKFLKQCSSFLSLDDSSLNGQHYFSGLVASCQCVILSLKEFFCCIHSILKGRIVFKVCVSVLWKICGEKEYSISVKNKHNYMRYVNTLLSPWVVSFFLCYTTEDFSSYEFTTTPHWSNDMA